MPPRVRIGAVSFLNTKPLVYGMERGLGAEQLELSYDVPSALAGRMSAGQVDVALLPIIELAHLPDLEVVPGLGISSQGPARSVLLVSREPLQRVRSVALDGESRTSNALAQVLFAEAWGQRPHFEPGPADLECALAEHDAAVRIGDKALFEALPAHAVAHDLGRAWNAATGLPFVFAVWAARGGVVDRALYKILHASRREGVQATDRIAEEFVWNGKRDPAEVRRYLIEHIHYRLGSAEIEAMRHFFAAAARLGIIDKPPEIRLALQRWSGCHETASSIQRRNPS